MQLSLGGGAEKKNFGMLVAAGVVLFQRQLALAD